MEGQCTDSSSVNGYHNQWPPTKFGTCWKYCCSHSLSISFVCIRCLWFSLGHPQTDVPADSSKAFWNVTLHYHQLSQIGHVISVISWTILISSLVHQPPSLQTRLFDVSGIPWSFSYHQWCLPTVYMINITEWTGTMRRPTQRSNRPRQHSIRYPPPLHQAIVQRETSLCQHYRRDVHWRQGCDEAVRPMTGVSVVFSLGLDIQGQQMECPEDPTSLGAVLTETALESFMRPKHPLLATQETGQELDASPRRKEEAHEEREAYDLYLYQLEIVGGRNEGVEFFSQGTATTRKSPPIHLFAQLSRLLGKESCKFCGSEF